MSIAEIKYTQACTRGSDINEHLPTLRSYSEFCDHITELGVRGIVSTWAFLIAKPKKLVSVDIISPDDQGGNLQEVYDAANELGVEFQFILGDDLRMDIEETDLLFIDTNHVYDQLIQELNLLSYKARKYIIMHDTYTFGSHGMDGGPGLLQAINEFLQVNTEWKIAEQFFNNNGLTVLSRV
jgi:hypothetical protein